VNIIDCSAPKGADLSIHQLPTVFQTVGYVSFAHFMGKEQKRSRSLFKVKCGQSINRKKIQICFTNANRENTNCNSKKGLFMRIYGISQALFRKLLQLNNTITMEL
jgi:hypothetical protein